jgi:hypothetical protein
LAQLSCLFDWRNALTVVKPDTLIRWHGNGFRFFWKLKSRPRGRPRIPARVRNLIAEMASSNPTWGEERIADELFLKMGIRISPKTVRRFRMHIFQMLATRWITSKQKNGLRFGPNRALAFHARIDGYPNCDYRVSTWLARE